MWPGAGLLSSKVHEFIRPQRHTLIEPDWKKYKRYLEPLAKDDSSYKCLSLHPYKQEGLVGLVEKHLSEHGMPRDQALDLVKDKTLLVLANCPVMARSDTPTPSWWIDAVDACVRTPGDNLYGSVQILASVPTVDARYMIPKVVTRRRRGAVVFESIATDVFQVAETPDLDSYYVSAKSLDLITANAAHVSAKAAALNVTTPPGREPPGFNLVPPVPPRGVATAPYIPRVRTKWHDKMLEEIEAGDDPRADYATAQRQSKAHRQMIQENRRAYLDQEGLRVGIELDRLNQRLSRDAANPDLDSRILQPLADKVKAKQASWSELLQNAKSDGHGDVALLVDGHRAALARGDFDSALMFWDRRPFAPLTVQPDEFYPHDPERAMIYIGTDSSSAYTRRLKGLDPDVRTEVLELADSFMFVLNTRSGITLSELFETLFPRQPANNLVAKIPSLALLANKSMKPNFDDLPKTLHSGPETRQGENGPDPVECFQENLDYDLSDVRLRTLSPLTILEIALLYQQSPDKWSAVQLARALGSAVVAHKAGRAGKYT